MRAKENCVDSSKAMEIAFRNIMDEMIENIIEGVCFETHRALKLGYFPLHEFFIRDQEYTFEIMYQKTPKDGDIFANDTNNIEPMSVCPLCNQKKATSNMVRHVNICRSKPNDSPSWDNNGGKREIYENNVDDGNNSDGNDSCNRKKGNDAKRQVKSSRLTTIIDGQMKTSAPNYETMSPDQIQEFLLKHCGVVSRHTGKPCSNSLNCNMHFKEDKDEVRRFIFASLADHLADGNIDIDTVD